ncbi:tetratricopeptide repeat protein [Chitinophaga lutea]
MRPFAYTLLLLTLAACQPSAPGRNETAALPADSLATAIDNLRKDLAIRPGDPETLNYLANALAEHGDLKAADSIAALFTQDTAQAVRASYIRAYIALRQQDTSATLRHLSEAMRTKGMATDYQAIMLAGDLYFAKDSLRQALGSYRLALAADSTSSEALYGIGQCEDRQGNAASASQAYKQAVLISPDYASAYIALGVHEENKGNWKEAFRYYNLAAKADPTDADAFYSRGKALLQLGDKPAGRDDLTKALSFRKDFPAAKALLDAAMDKKFQ